VNADESEPPSLRSLSRPALIDKNNLVGTRRFGSEQHEAEGLVEAVCIGAVGPQPQAGEVTACQSHDRTDKPRADPPAPIIDGDIKVANSANRRIADVRITAQPAHSDDTSVVIGDEEGFSSLVETVQPRVPFTQEAGESMEPAGIRFRHPGR
jgi:hypothetical protein